MATTDIAPRTSETNAVNVVERFAAYALVPGRALLASMFLASGASKITAYAAMEGYMAAFGIPPALLPVVIAFQLGAGLALLMGFGARIAAFLLAGFSVLTAVMYHTDFTDQIQIFMFQKNLAIAGGLLAIVAAGPGRFSVDRRF